MKKMELFAERHLGPRPDEINHMLEVIGVKDIKQLVSETVPEQIRITDELELPAALSEFEYLNRIRTIAQKNQIFRSYIGLGYYNCIVPTPILRNVLENPGWYTQYTPYQSEISQGRLEALLNYQTMIQDLTGLPVANASLLDEGTACAEAMMLLHRSRPAKLKAAHKFFVSNNIFPQTMAVLKLRAEPLGVEIVSGEPSEFTAGPEYFGLLLQYPDNNGAAEDHSSLIARAQKQDVRVVLAADLLSLALLKPPGEMGADVAVGSAQRFGVPPGFGGPHAAYLATSDELKRQIPGRIIGVSVDSKGRTAYRMALQTREQHIRREKATSNICTAQALLAIMAGMYGVYHGPNGLRRIALRVHNLTAELARILEELGYRIQSQNFFDTLRIAASESEKEKIKNLALKREINLNYVGEGLSLSLDETVNWSDINDLIAIFAEAAGKAPIDANEQALDSEETARIGDEILRRSSYLTHPVFNSHHSETALMRYIRVLEGRDLALNRAMIPLGSCTMKLNSATSMEPVSWPEFALLHPFAPTEQAAGYLEIIRELETALCRITGLAACSLQPNSGAQGEFAGLMIIREYHKSQGDTHRTKVLIPSSAHGTNPASAAMAGMDTVVIKCAEDGSIDLEDLQAKAEKHSDELAGLMVTYPSTHGVFEEDIQKICAIVHEQGGQVYLDGANLNAMVGLSNLKILGADVCHLNLHKTFGIPHGGGGPGVGPICMAEHLAPFAPGHPLQPELGGDKAILPISAAPYGSANVLLISHAYISMLGPDGLTEATKYAILNANYIMARLKNEYRVLYTGKNGRVAHEMILDLRPFKKEAGVEIEDVAKRLIDYGFHAPTMSWPIPGTLMVEPTESEPLSELDRFCEAMLVIRSELQEIIAGKSDREDNPLKNAPHPAEDLAAEEWGHSYSREKAAFPVESLKGSKFWPVTSRIDNVYGDRNLACSCPTF